MKSKTFAVILLIAAASTSYGQNSYFIAVNIRSKCTTGAAELAFKNDDASKDQLATYLKSTMLPVVRTNPHTNNAQILAAFKDNPFFGAQIKAIQGGRNENKEITAIFSQPSSGLGSFNVTNIADGIAQFLVERAKEELFLSFIEKIQQFLNNKAPEIDTLFPNTLILLNNFKSWDYANMLTTLRAAVDKDLQQLMGNIVRLKNMDTAGHGYTKTVSNRVQRLKVFLSSDKGRLFLSVLYTGNGFITAQKIPDILNTLVTDPSYLPGLSDDALAADARNAITLINIISSSLESTDAGKNYITADQLAELNHDPALGTIYFGLIYQEILQNKITIGNTAVATLLTPGHVDGITTYITNLIAQGKDVDAAIQNLKNAKRQGTKDLSTYWEAILQSSSQFLIAASNIAVIDPSLQFSPQVQELITRIEQAFEIGQDIAIKNYNAAVVGTLKLVNAYLPPNTEMGETVQAFVKYVSFAGNLVAAQSADDAKKAIEAIALPAGSASIKKNSRFNISLNTYLGGFYGNEYVPSLSKGKWSMIAGVTAPIGVAFSKPIVIKNSCNWGSATLFVTLLDIGAFASYRLNDTSTAKLPNVTLSNIWSPGIGIVWGLPKVPLSIGYGYQWGPNLRDINPNAATVTTGQLNRRWDLFLAVDIPLINFFTKSR